MKHTLTTLIFAFLAIGVFAQNEMMHVPNGTSGISATTDSRGVGIGADLSAPDARLHVTDNTSDGTILLIEGQESQLDPIDPTGSGGGVPTFTRPEYLIRADFDPIIAPIGQANTQFSVDINGKIQSGLFSSAVNEQLAVKKNLALYNSINQRIKLEVTSQFARLLWKAPGNNFQFVNEDEATVALQLGEFGDVGINTGTFTSAHKLHVEGGALADYSVVQPAANWIPGGNYLGMYFSDRPEIRWDSDATSYFEFKAADTGEVPLRLSSAGKVGINTDCISGTHSLFIEGSAIAEEIFVQLKSDWCDYVFEEDYYLRPLAEVEDYIKDNGHLPNIPSAAEIEETGIPLGEMERLLTEKVEELTLYIIQMQKEIDTLKKEIKD